MTGSEEIQFKKLILPVISVLTTTVLAFGLLYIFFFSSNNTALGSAVTDGNSQVLRMSAKGGFTPQKSTIVANKATVLRVSTKDTFDCSSTLEIPQLAINQSLPISGTTDIALPPQTAGTVLKGQCGMNHYQFEIDVIQG